MNISRICGLETEYGLLVAGEAPFGQKEAARALLERCPLEPRVKWAMIEESPNRDARNEQRQGGGRARLSSDQPSPLEAGFMLGNGARFYVDHGHPEYCTPECAGPAALVASDKAGERILNRCRRELMRFLPLGLSVRLFKNNSDYLGHSYGCHENYLMSVDSYRSLFRYGGTRAQAHLVPFLVSRSVICGAGKVGSENGRPVVDFQISQRADFFERIVGLGTMSHRPIINTRDEAHADRCRYRRLHVITGDSNMAEVSTYLKVGTLQLLLSMLEEGTQIPDLTLADPVAAMVEISHDPTCQRRVRLADGRRLNAIEIQKTFAEAAAKHLALRSGSEERTVLETWDGILNRLARDPMDLSTTLDWVIKKRFLEEWRERKGLAWDAAELKELALRYHDIDPGSSIFHLLATSRPIDRVVEEVVTERALVEPLSQTRAQPRAATLRADPGALSAASWSVLIGTDPRGKTTYEFLDPLAAGH